MAEQEWKWQGHDLNKAVANLRKRYGLSVTEAYHALTGDNTSKTTKGLDPKSTLDNIIHRVATRTGQAVSGIRGDFKSLEETIEIARNHGYSPELGEKVWRDNLKHIKALQRAVKRGKAVFNQDLHIDHLFAANPANTELSGPWHWRNLGLQMATQNGAKGNKIFKDIAQYAENGVPTSFEEGILSDLKEASGAAVKRLTPRQTRSWMKPLTLGAKTAAGLTALGVLGDSAKAASGTSQLLQTGGQKGGLDALSGYTGLASLRIAPLRGPAIGMGLAELARPLSDSLGKKLGQALIPAARKLDDLLPGVNSKDEARRNLELMEIN